MVFNEDTLKGHWIEYVERSFLNTIRVMTFVRSCRTTYTEEAVDLGYH